MKRYLTLHRLLALALAATPFLNCGGSSTSNSSAGGGGTGGSGGSDNACEIAADCAWGEIEHEIRRRADCPCLFGCPSIPQNVETVTRRRDQYERLCDPQTDGEGNPCPIDDCIVPPPLLCTDSVCTSS